MSKYNRSAARAATSLVAVSVALAAWVQPSFGQSAGSIFDRALKLPGQVTDVISPKPRGNNQKDGAQPDAVNTTAGVVGILGVGLCAKNAKTREKNALCALGAVAATEVTRLLGNKIADGLKESEQRQVLSAATVSLKTGEPAVVELPESGATVAITPAGKTSTREIQVPLLVDSAALKDVPKFHSVGASRDAASAVKLYGGPGESLASVGALKSGETVHALGEVDGSWVLVSRWMDDGVYPKPIATGFASGKALRASKKKDFPGESDVIKSVSGAQTLTVTAIVRCSNLDFKKVDAQGNKAEDASTYCVRPDGSLLSS